MNFAFAAIKAQEMNATERYRNGVTSWAVRHNDWMIPVAGIIALTGKDWPDVWRRIVNHSDYQLFYVCDKTRKLCEDGEAGEAFILERGDSISNHKIIFDKKTVKVEPAIKDKYHWNWYVVEASSVEAIETAIDLGKRKGLNDFTYKLTFNNKIIEMAKIRLKK